MTYFSLVKTEGGTKSLSVIYDQGKPTTIPSSHPQFDVILDLFQSGEANDDNVRELVNTYVALGVKMSRLSERVTFTNRQVLFDGDPIRGELVDTIADLVEKHGTDDDSLKPLVNFLEKAHTNPSIDAVDGLYRWIKNGDLVITPNGDFVGYKGVKTGEDGVYESILTGTAIVNGTVHTGNIPNPDGAIVEMPRSEVDPSLNATCSVGLHVGTASYALGFAHTGTLLVQVNPRDVVAIPSSESMKIRVCRYVVIGHTEKKLEERVYSGNYVEDDYEYYEDTDEDYDECNGQCDCDCYDDGSGDESNEEESNASLSDGNLTLHVDGSISAQHLNIPNVDVSGLRDSMGRFTKDGAKKALRDQFGRFINPNKGKNE